jgi:arylsulfatase A-like enzyme
MRFITETVITAFILTGLSGCGSAFRSDEGTTRKPNVIIILCDDLGYGDLGCQGHPLIRTPNIDRLAKEGQRWTSFYSSSCVCNPSRAALLTGRLPYRIHEGQRIWAPLPAGELTLAEMLSGQGYATACIGKWHLGMKEGEHPNDQGFDYYFGLAGSNDAPIREGSGFTRTYENVKNARFTDFDISLYRQSEVIEDTVRQDLLTRRYTEESVHWIAGHSEQAFFLYLAHNMPHVPVYASPEFQGHSKAGLYGDVIEELDWSVGRLIETLRQEGIDRNTLVIFTSDNGPWLTYYDLGGSLGHLRDGKFTAWEGGFRVTGIFWWPGSIQPAVVTEMGANVDLMATLAGITGAELPGDRYYDSQDLSPVLLEGKPGSRREFIYYGMNPDGIWALRQGDLKIHLLSRESIGTEKTGWRGYSEVIRHEDPLLFDLGTDVSERLDLSSGMPEEVAALKESRTRHMNSMGINEKN